MKKPSNLLDQEDAVGSYLADMLSQPDTDSSESAGLLQTQPLDNLVLLRQALEELPAVEAEETAVESAAAEIQEPAQEVPAPTEAEAPARPLEFPLQCLMFSVGKQQLSMPLIQMSGVVEAPESLSRLPGSSDCVRGTFQYRGSNVQVIDSALLLGIQRDSEQSPAKLIVLQGDQWAITVDNIASVVAIDEADVKWHKTRHSNMMLGTIKSSLAQLLSPQTIVENLDGGKVF